jgi:hypothetical protein
MSALAGCALPSNLRDASVPSGETSVPEDSGVVDDVTVSMPDVVVSLPDAVEVEGGGPIDTGVIDAGGGPAACSMATRPVMIAPVSGAAYATQFVNFIARAPLGSQVEFEHANNAAFASPVAATQPVDAEGRAVLPVLFSDAQRNQMRFVRARVLCAGGVRGVDTSAPRSFRIGTRLMDARWTAPVVETFELDVDGDGRTDIGAPIITTRFGGASSVRVYRSIGGASQGVSGSSTFGRALAAVGDIDGDGFGDVLVGEYLADVGGTAAGRAAVFRGSNAGLVETVRSELFGPARSSAMGRLVAGLGDLNGDGLADLAATSEIGTSTSIHVYLSPHSSRMLSPAQSLTVSSFSDPTAMVAGDLNGDGRSEIIVGFAGANTDLGAVFVFSSAPAGSPNPYVLTPAQLATTAARGRMGAALAVGAFTNDGALDLLVGAPGNASAGTGGGVLLYSNPAVSATATLMSVGFGSPTALEDFAVKLSTVGDFDRDGSSEWLVIHPGRVAGPNRGAVWLGEYAGGMLTTAALINGTSPTITNGQSVVGVGNFLDGSNTGSRLAFAYTRVSGTERELLVGSLSGGGAGVFSSTPSSFASGAADFGTALVGR